MTRTPSEPSAGKIRFHSTISKEALAYFVKYAERYHGGVRNIALDNLILNHCTPEYLQLARQIKEIRRKKEEERMREYDDRPLSRN